MDCNLTIALSSEPCDCHAAAIKVYLSSSTIQLAYGLHRKRASAHSQSMPCTDACLLSPARIPQSITVAASDKKDMRWADSNYGTCVDLYAPGVDITSSMFTSDTAIITATGTSMACPHVSGVAAQYLQVRS